MPINIYTTPLDIEPLPVYRRDPETASIISSAPSYRSEAPTYHSRRESQPHPPPANLRALNNTSTSASASTSTSTNNINNNGNNREQEDLPQGLPAVQFAPGFHSRGQGTLSDPERHSYNVSQWSSTSTSHASRQLHAVARRRASQAIASASTTSLLNSLSAAPPPTTTNTTTTPPSSAPTASRSTTPPQTTSPTASSTTLPLINTSPSSPLEDPYLVGEAAAQRARHARIYREMCLRGDEALRSDGQTWDFMMGQMTDWNERGRSWSGFRERVMHSSGYPAYGFGLGGGAVGAVSRTRKGMGLRGKLGGLAALRSG